MLERFRRYRLARTLHFDGFRHYVQERLGMSLRRAYYLVELEQALERLPRLEEAYRTEQLTWFQAWLIKKVADASTIETWIGFARTTTADRLEHEVEAKLPLPPSNPGRRPPADRSTPPAEAAETAASPASTAAPADALPETCAQKARIAFWAPERPLCVIRTALTSVRLEVGRPELPDWACFQVLIDVFVTTNDSGPTRAMRRAYPIFERDGWRCRTPGCRGTNLHVHHIIFRSRGGMTRHITVPRCVLAVTGRSSIAGMRASGRRVLAAAVDP